MDRPTLEEQLRQTLAAEAETVRPAPDLWERVADRTTRRSPWRSPAMWGGLAAAAAAIVAAVVIVPGLYNQPDAPVIDNPPSETSAPDAAPIDDQATRLVVAREGENSIGGLGGLYEVAPGSGQSAGTIFEGQPERDAPFTTSLDVRPDGSGEVAVLVTIEGQWDIRVLDGAGDFVASFAVGDFVDGTDFLSRRVRWSQDAHYLVWTSLTADQSSTELHVLDWEAFLASPAVDDPTGNGATAFAQTFAPEGWRAGTRLLDVLGVRGEELVVRAAAEGQPVDVMLTPTGDCLPEDCTYDAARSNPEQSFVPTLVAAADSGLNPGFFVGPSYELTIDDEGQLHLDIAQDGDGAPVPPLTLPDDLQTMDGNIADTWMDAAGSTVVIGRGGRAWLLTVDLEAREVVRTVEVEGGATTATLGRNSFVPGGGGEPGAAGELRVEIQQIIVTPNGQVVDVDSVRLVGAGAPSALERVNEGLASVSGEAIDEWDTNRPGETDPPAEFTLKATTTRLEPTLLSVVWDGYRFEGGANGQSYWQTLTYDLTTGDPLAFSSVFDPEQTLDVAVAVAAALHPQVVDALSAAELEDLLASDPTLALNNLAVTDTGLRFHLDQGAIGPRALGALSVDVRSTDLIEHMVPGVVRDLFAGATPIG